MHSSHWLTGATCSVFTEVKIHVETWALSLGGDSRGLCSPQLVVHVCTQLHSLPVVVPQ